MIFARIAQVFGLNYPQLPGAMPDVGEVSRQSSVEPMDRYSTAKHYDMSLSATEDKLISNLRARFHELEVDKHRRVRSLERDYERVERAHRGIIGQVHLIEYVLLRTINPELTITVDRRRHFEKISLESDIPHFAKRLTAAHLSFILLYSDYKGQFLTINRMLEDKILVHANRIVRYRGYPEWLKFLLSPYNDYNVEQVEHYKKMILDLS